LAVASAGCTLVSIHGTTVPSGCITFTCRRMNNGVDEADESARRCCA
jgi:hypothetical protein